MGDEENEWKYGLCSCSENSSVCVMTFFCPWLTFGEVASKVGEDYGICGFFYPFKNLYWFLKVRHQIRESKDIGGNRCGDCFVLLCCSFCGLVQMARETEGDPSRAQGLSMVRE